MKNSSVTVTSFLEIVSLAGVKRARSGIIRRNFSPKETDRLNDAPLQSIAGMLALKKALAKMIAAVCGVRMGGKEIVLSNDKNGGPRLVALPAKSGSGMPDKKDIRISISHSKTHAYGLAVLKQREKRNGA
jgi:phosphopantetheinyl transferase (holo-ACP synthase)